MKTATANGMTKQDAKYLSLMDDYLRQIKETRVAMRRSQAGIERLKATSLRKLAEIDSVLNRVEAAL